MTVMTTIPFGDVPVGGCFFVLSTLYMKLSPTAVDNHPAPNINSMRRGP